MEESGVRDVAVYKNDFHRDGPKRRKVDIKDRSELMMWCRRLGVTPFQLCSIVDRVGSEVALVQHAIRAR